MNEKPLYDAARIKERLKEKIQSMLPEAGRTSLPVSGLAISRRLASDWVENCFGRPCVAIVLQGRKEARFGNAHVGYGEDECAVTYVDLPYSFSVTEGSLERPFLAVALELDYALTAQFLAEIPPRPGTARHICQGISVAPADPGVMDTFLRLLDIVDNPRQQALASLFIRELHCRLLLGPHGEDLRKICTLGSQVNQIAQAVSWIRQNYKKALDVDALAKQMHMSPSSFHRHFKDMTTLSPLQFQKRLRLYEAQRLMLLGEADASNASLSVGYESVTQFTREYKRQFGAPPRRDIVRLRGCALPSETRESASGE